MCLWLACVDGFARCVGRRISHAREPNALSLSHVDTTPRRRSISCSGLGRTQTGWASRSTRRCVHLFASDEACHQRSDRGNLRPQLPPLRAASHAGGPRVVRCKYCACSGQGREGVSGSRLAWGRATALEARGAADEGRSCLQRAIRALWHTIRSNVHSTPQSPRPRARR